MYWHVSCAILLPTRVENIISLFIILNIIGIYTLHIIVLKQGFNEILLMLCKSEYIKSKI